MIGRPMLRLRVLSSTAEAWIGRPYRQIADGDMWRFWTCQEAARRIEKRLARRVGNG